MARLLLALILIALAPWAGAATPAPAPPSSADAERPAAGTVDFVEGTVTAIRVDGSKVRLAKGDSVYETDSVVTAADGEVHLQMADGGYVAVRPSTKMRIATFRANGDESDRSIFGVLEGSLRIVSGWIGKFNPKGYEVRSKVATIGIRGTDHETLIRARGDADGEPGVYDRVFAGETFIRSKHGEVTVKPGRAGFQHATRAERPRVLDRVPKFFRPTRNERLIEGRHERIQKQLHELREQRRAKVREAVAAKHGKARKGEHAPHKAKGEKE